MINDSRGPFRDNLLWVYARKCDTCIYRPGNLMHLKPGARDELARRAVDDNSVIICHEHQDDDRRSICRGFHDVHHADVTPLRLAQALGRLGFDDPPGSTP